MCVSLCCMSEKAAASADDALKEESYECTILLYVNVKHVVKHTAQGAVRLHQGCLDPVQEQPKPAGFSVPPGRIENLAGLLTRGLALDVSCRMQLDPQNGSCSIRLLYCSLLLMSIRFPSSIPFKAQVLASLAQLAYSTQYVSETSSEV